MSSRGSGRAPLVRSRWLCPPPRPPSREDLGSGPVPRVGRPSQRNSLHCGQLARMPRGHGRACPCKFGGQWWSLPVSGGISVPDRTSVGSRPSSELLQAGRASTSQCLPKRVRRAPQHRGLPFEITICMAGLMPGGKGAYGSLTGSVSHSRRRTACIPSLRAMRIPAPCPSCRRTSRARRICAFHHAGEGRAGGPGSIMDPMSGMSSLW